MSSSPRVLLVATTTGYQTRSFGEAAEKLGIRLVFATDRCDRLEDPWWDQAIPIRFHDEYASAKAIVTALRDGPVRGVLAVGDRPALIAAYAAEALGLPGNDPKSVQICGRKDLTQIALSAEGEPVRWFARFDIDCDPRTLVQRVPYPCVVKPLAMSGSRGVIRADSPAEFVAAFDRVRRLLRQRDVRMEGDPAHDAVLVESFVPGHEYAIEGMVHQGEFHALAVFDKPDPLDGPFFEETIYVTPPDIPAADHDRIIAAVAHTIEILQLAHGPVHAEVRVNADSIVVLEVAARPIGGLCSRALRFVDASGATPHGSAISLEELLLRHAMGDPVTGFAREPLASGVMMIPIPARGIYRSVEGIEDARRVSNVDEVRITAKPDQLLVPLPEGKSYLGFVFARAERPGAVIQSLRDAHARLRFKIDRELRVVAVDEG